MVQVSRDCDELLPGLIMECEAPAFFGSVRADRWPAIRRALDRNGGEWLAVEIMGLGVVLGYLVVAGNHEALQRLADGPPVDGVKIADTATPAALSFLWRDLARQTIGYKLVVAESELTGAKAVQVVAGKDLCRLLAGKGWAGRLNQMMEAGVDGGDDVMV